MSEPIDILALYLHLATASEQRRRPHVRDRLLVIAATIAARCNLTRIAEHCKSKILEHNPHHLIGRWESVEVALEDSDFLHLLRSVQRQYPQEKAERLLETLGVERGSERTPTIRTKSLLHLCWESAWRNWTICMAPKMGQATSELMKKDTGSTTCRIFALVQPLSFVVPVPFFTSPGRRSPNS
jgi:hypothetical protein